MNPLIKIPVEGLISHSYLLLISSDGSILFKNEKWNTITGKGNSFQSVFDLVCPFEIPKLKNTFEKIIGRHGSSVTHSFKLNSYYSDEIYFEAKFYSYLDDTDVKILLMADDVTDKVRLTNRLLFGFENNKDVIYEMDIRNRRYNYVSPACYELFEITPEEALNTRPGTLEYKIHTEDFLAVHDHFRNICKLPGIGKKSFYIKYRYFHSQSGLKWVIDRHTVFYNSRSQPYLMIGNIRDISDLEFSYERVARNERMFKGIVDNSIDIITMIDRYGIIKFVSPSVEPILGYKPEEIINRHPFEIMDSSMHGEVSRTMQQLLENPGKVIESEMYFKYASGRDVYLKSKFINYLDDPHVQAILGSTQDITEQKLNEQKLKDSYTELYHIINNSDDPIWSVDSEMRLTVFNEAFVEMVQDFYGFIPMRGQQLFDTIVEYGNPDQTECRNNFCTALTGKKIRFERIYEFDNSKVIMDYSVSPLYNSEGVVTGATCFGRNITEKVLIHLQLKEQNDELTKANRELDRFVYSMSHDLRSPVASALGLIQVMELETEDADVLRHVHMLKKRLSRLDALIDDILVFAKQRKEDVKLSRIDFDELIEDIFENRGYRDETSDLELNVHTESDVPIITDLARLTTVMENLISNAIKYRDNIKTTLKLDISCSASADQVIIKVKDNGIGIADKHKEKIFDMFYRASSLSNGSGLGLYIVKENLESMQGSIQLESVLMEGSLFTVQFKNHFNSNLINHSHESIKNHLDNR